MHITIVIIIITYWLTHYTPYNYPLQQKTRVHQTARYKEALYKSQRVHAATYIAPSPAAHNNPNVNPLLARKEEKKKGSRPRANKVHCISPRALHEYFMPSFRARLRTPACLLQLLDVMGEK